MEDQYNPYKGIPSQDPEILAALNLFFGAGQKPTVGVDAQWNGIPVFNAETVPADDEEDPEDPEQLKLRQRQKFLADLNLNALLNKHLR